jgi:hypothetical protein
MAASRSMLEALLARVQQRASEPRSVDSRTADPRAAEPKTAAPDSQRPSASAASAPPAGEAPPDSENARTLRPPSEELADEDIEEYDDELIEIIDDAEVIPQAAAAARAIDGRALVASLERRSNSNAVAHDSNNAPASAPASKRASSAPASVRAVVARPAEPANGVLRPESVSPRPVVAAEVAVVRGGRRELRASSFVELLDASLKLGS